MNKFVVDTHIFLWLIFSPEKIATTKINVLKNPNEQIFISCISFWEISIKFNLGKIELYGYLPSDLPELAEQMGLEILPMDYSMMASFYQLQRVEKHKDPFDRLIIWQCICQHYTLISHDTKFAEYQKMGLITR